MINIFKISVILIVVYIAWTVFSTFSSFNTMKEIHASATGLRELGRVYKENSQVGSELIRRNTPECLQEYTNIPSFRPGVTDYYANLTIYAIDNVLKNSDRGMQEHSMNGRIHVNKIEREMARVYGNDYVDYLKKNVSFMHNIDLKPVELINMQTYYTCLVES